MDTQCFTIYVIIMMTVSVSTAKDDPPDLQPAEIYGSSIVEAGSDVKMKCRTLDNSGLIKEGNMYLCKNGVGVMMEPPRSKDEHIFTLRNVSVLDSGNYSCVYSLKKYLPKIVRASGQRSIQLQVKSPASLTITRTTSHSLRNSKTNGQNPTEVQPNGLPRLPVEHMLLGILILVGTIFLGMFCIKIRMFKKLCKNQEPRYI
ncbi:hypothetical protein AOLI_G00093880 [Acnodon oligacanthus]